MKILLINEVCGRTSTGRICAEIAAHYEAAGHKVKIAYGRNRDVPAWCEKYAGLEMISVYMPMPYTQGCWTGMDLVQGVQPNGL